MCPYGRWMPNDSRGSHSNWVWNKSIFIAGSRIIGEKTGHFDESQFNRQIEKLKHKPVTWDKNQILCIAKAIEIVFAELDAPVYACAILPDHAHILSGWHRPEIHKVVAVVKETATAFVIENGLHPYVKEEYIPRYTAGVVASPSLAQDVGLRIRWRNSRFEAFSKRETERLERICDAAVNLKTPPFFADKSWVNFVDSVDWMERGISYIAENYDKHNMPRVEWPFIETFTP